ncbi:hypothetical protein CBR_g4892 [Chara braunii]|uniref:Association with the SNF1 complex (ASC) domain-containing protein n=1 Tax=Chara braunii TaxID=69332 RepID=A0A388KJ32_CHABU|nr:hypothetical protein CBR_g4892 [Chara braunii]|eukprot:GBG70064.1 hypothetical protein CBR_g4892 [Chara braunii]
MGNTPGRDGRGHRGERTGAREGTRRGGGGGGARAADGRGGGPSHSNSSESMGSSPPGSPGGTGAMSPLLFTPQIPMTPIPKADEVVLPPYSYPAANDAHRHQLDDANTILALIIWTHGGNNVSVEGSWDNWHKREPLSRSGKDFALIKRLPSGIYQYKFIVDEQWRFAPDLPSIHDEMGNVNNVLEVQETVSENFENLAGFEPPRSPDSSYNNAFFAPEDYTKEPPAIPPHLHLTPLNVTGVSDNQSLPRPQHVILNHVYVEKGKTARSVLALGATQRYRSKYVTVVLYKPLHK